MPAPSHVLYVAPFWRSMSSAQCAKVKSSVFSIQEGPFHASTMDEQLL